VVGGGAAEAPGRRGLRQQRAGGLAARRVLRAALRLFLNRPFIWHIWDGRRDGFAALVNYHKLNAANLDKLIYTYLGNWIETQRADAGRGVAGADGRLVAGLGLKQKLELIRDGEPPYDIYVRWKPLAEQPVGWNPDLNDGVRLNIRPFVTAGVLRTSSQSTGTRIAARTGRQRAAERPALHAGGEAGGAGLGSMDISGPSARFLAELFGTMVANRAIPKYQFERRVDAILAIFLPELLSNSYGWEVEIVVPEFPIKKRENNKARMSITCSTGTAVKRALARPGCSSS